MSMHRNLRSRRWISSTRLRAVLGLGVALGIGATGTLAAWTDDVVISGSTFTAGTLDLQVNNLDTVTGYTSLNLTNMAPGNSNAALLTIKNNGSATLKYTATSVATNTVSGKDVAAALAVKVTGDTAVTGSGVAKTCAGTALAGTGSSSLNGTIITTGRQLAPGASEVLCVQVTFSSSAATGLQGGGATATFTFTGTSDLS